MNTLIHYTSVENLAGTDIKLKPSDKVTDNDYIEQEYSATSLKQIQKEFKADRKIWLKNAFGYLE
jgi:hypothetical protein